ncbi:hypothetical protein [Jannaschia formosa]|uniref:hypothetical protein n=1 Tax=Jannaschia formosa TaxID=2259592 RepID=UPI000E1C113B|nr:hypothetical protein [Jannaschia formosa]TFL16681.1 hypothetical protein DR046_18565 [Jannaschia formosa]
MTAFAVLCAATAAAASTVRYSLDVNPLELVETRYRPTGDGGYEIAEIRTRSLSGDFDFFIEFDASAMPALVRDRTLTFRTEGGLPRGLPLVTDITRNCCFIEGRMTFDAAYRVTDWEIYYADDHPHVFYSRDEVRQYDVFGGWSTEHDGHSIVEGSLRGPFLWEIAGDLPRRMAPVPVPLAGSLTMLGGALAGLALWRRWRGSGPRRS